MQITRTGCPSAQNCSFGNYPTESSFALPFTQQKIFQNPRPSSQQDFYVFYATNVSLAGSGCTSNGAVTNLCYECVYAYSPDGVGWRVNQTIGSGPAGVGNFYINCSAAYFDDAANNQLIVYVVAARNAASVNTNHNIEFVIGTVSDSANAVSWGSVQIVSSSSSTQNFQYPVIQVDPNGYPQIAYSWVDTSVNRQTVDLCSSQTAHPTVNPSWTCSGGLNSSLFNAQTQAGQAAGSFMPQLQPVPGHSVLVLQGPCSSIATSGCAQAVSLTESATLVDWSGTTQTFKPTGTFVYPGLSASDRRSSTVEAATGTFYLAYLNGTDSHYWTRYMAKPYTAWSNPNIITSDGGEGRILLLSGTGTPETLVFILATDQPKTVGGGGGSGTCGSCASINMYVNTTRTATAWSSATTLYSNTTWAATWANVPWTVNTSTNSKMPIMWEQHVCGYLTNVPCTTHPEEMWFDQHTLYTPSSSQLKASFSYTPTTPTTGQTVTFTATASGGTSPYSYSWNFGDGMTGTGSSTTHTYSSPGTFNVALTVKDSGSPQQTANSQKTVTVTSQPLPLTVSFAFNPPSPEAGQQVTFTASASGGTSPYTFSWNFEDAGTATVNPATHTYSSSGSFVVTVTAKDATGASASSSQTVTVAAAFGVSFTISPASPEANLVESFTATTTGGVGPDSFRWDFGDGGASTANPASHTYTTSGSFTVVVTVTDSNGAKATSSQTINLASALTVSFTAKPSSPTVNQAVTFTATTSGGVGSVRYSWSFGDGSASTTNPASHAYSTSGSFKVTVTATDANGAKAMSSQTITVAAILGARFTYSPSSPQVGQQVTLTGSVSGGTGPYTFSWAFGDGSTGSGQSTTHTYSSPGIFTLTLTVKDSSSSQQTATSQQSATVTSPPPLTARFSFTPSTPQTGQQITFTVSASGGTTPYSYSWMFGDGSSGTGSTVTHAYASAGTFTLVLTVKDGGSPQQTVTSQQSVTVTSPPPPPLSASFTFKPSSPDAGQAVSFIGSASGGVSPYSYSWSFGDGGTASGSLVSHTFQSAGTYTVILTIKDSAGQIAKSSQTITVNARPSASISYSPSNPLPLLSVTFTGSATGGTQPYSYSWDFGDGTTASGQTVSHSYLLPGSYVVTLTITDANGQTFTTSRTIIVLTNLL